MVYMLFFYWLIKSKSKNILQLSQPPEGFHATNLGFFWYSIDILT